MGMAHTQCMSTLRQRLLAVPDTQFSAAFSAMNPEMLICPMTAQDKDYYFPPLFGASRIK